MKKAERQNQILEYITRRKKAEVVELSALLQVSQVTIRKDLDELEEKDLIHRKHGFAVRNNPDNINGRLAYHYEEKKKIAFTASTLVKDGDIIFIESGSCCALLAMILATKKKDLTILTNSAFICEYIRPYFHGTLILLGGIYQPSSQCVVGPMIKELTRKYYVHSFFIGADGYTEKTGFTNKDTLRAQAVKDMAESAENIYVVSESDKIGHAGNIPMELESHPVTLITDTNLTDSQKQSLQKNHIAVIQAK